MIRPEKNFLLIVCLLLAFSCDSQKQQETSSEPDLTASEIIVTNDAKDVSSQSMSDIVAEHFYVPLETSKDALIGEISHFLISDNRIFISDQVSNTLFIYNREGKFVNKIVGNDEGPERFNNLVSFSVDFKGERIFIGSSGKIIWYDYEGNYLDQIKTRLGGARQLAYTGNNRITVFTSYSFLGELEDQGFHNVVIFDVSTKEVVKKAIPFDQSIRVENMTGMFNNFSQNTSNNPYLTIEYENFILQVKEDQVTKPYQISFGDKGLPDNFKDEYLASPKYTSDDVRNEESINQWQRVRGGGALLTNDFLNFSYSEGNRFTELIYDKRSKKAISFRVPLENDLDGTKYVVQRSVYANYFVSILSSNSFLKAIDKELITNEKAVEKASSMEQEDNPVLRFIRFKDIL